VRSFSGVRTAQKGSRCQGAPSRLHRACLGVIDRQGPPRGALIHEIKFDRFTSNEAGSLPAAADNRTNASAKSADAAEIDAGSAIVDGEVVVPFADGLTDFAVLQNELKGRSTKIVLIAQQERSRSSTKAAPIWTIGLTTASRSRQFDPCRRMAGHFKRTV
jgi:hypothetical protein